MQKISSLAPGSGIGVVALGSPLNPERLAAGLREIERRGYRAVTVLDPSQYYGDHAQGFSNGSAEQRAESLHQLLDNSQVGAIITARGGYGVLDTFSLLDFSKISASGKALVGISDCTALLAQSGTAIDLPTIHGPTIGDLFADAQILTGESARNALDSLDCLFQLLEDRSYRYHQSCNVIRAGEAEGRILAGNLTMLTALLGTKWEPDFDRKILVLEEVGEAPYRIHRMFTQLKLAGKLEQLAGLVFGRFSKCEAKFGPSVGDVLDFVARDLIRNTAYPILSDLPFGHWGKNIALPLGCRAAIAGSDFKTLESPLK